MVRGGPPRVLHTDGWGEIPRHAIPTRGKKAMMDRQHERDDMGASQIAARGIRDPRVLDAMRKVPREAFVPESMREFAYRDAPLPIGEEQTISQPYIVALMLEAAKIAP